VASRIKALLEASLKMNNIQHFQVCYCSYNC